jgi:hypothetical protein
MLDPPPVNYLPAEMSRIPRQGRKGAPLPLSHRSERFENYSTPNPNPMISLRPPL